MKKRYLYSLLFGVPGFLVAGVSAALVGGMAVGVLWLFVFGDNPWPAITEAILPALLISVFLVTWLGLVGLGFFVGRRLESIPGVSPAHIALSIGATLGLLLFAVLSQAGSGIIWPAPVETRCMDFCVREGFTASSLSPRNAGPQMCSCLDAQGQEQEKVPVDQLDRGK